MAITKINNGRASNVAVSVANYGSRATFSKQYVEASGSVQLFNASGENSRLEPIYGGWSLGTGLNITTASVLVFDNVPQGGALSEATVVNRGSTDIYVAINQRFTTVSSGFMIASGESYKFQDGIIEQICAVTATGTGVLQAYGQKYFNSNLI